MKFLFEGTEVKVLDFAPGGQPGRDGVMGVVGVVRELRYEVREGREAGEVVCIPEAFIVKRNQSFLLLEVVNDGSEDQVHSGSEA